MKSTKKLSLLILTVFLTMIGITPVGATQHVSITEIREEVAGGWHETYEVAGESIIVDVEIEIPNVEKIPAVQVRLPGNLDLVWPADTIYQTAEPSGFSFAVEKGAASTDPNAPSLGRDEWFEEGARAENSPFSPEEAVAFFLTQIKPYTDAFAMGELQQARLYATSRAYVASDISASGATLDYNKPFSETGAYQIAFHQVFYGVPFLRSSPPFIWPPESSDYYERPLCDISGIVSSQDDYAINFYPVVEDEVVVEDLPLVPFSQVKQEFERLIKEGYVRDVFKVRLEYVCLDNPDDLGNSFILMPVWELNGTLVEKPEYPTPAFSEEQIQRLHMLGGQDALVNAQTGVYFDPQDQSGNRSHAEIITWEQVR